MSIIEQLVNIIMWPPFFYIIIAPGLITVLIVLLILIWAERKIAGRVQRRYGPLEIAPRIGGAIQLLADLIRYSFQEIIIPIQVDVLPYLTAPIIGFVFSLLPLEATPISPAYHPPGMNNSIIVALALTTVPPILTILASWASNNKFSLIGGTREAHIVVAYELIIIASTASMILLYSTLDFRVAVESQHRIWGALLNPVSALAFFVAVMMGTSRFPFEIAEAESEIVMGPYTEYSGLMYGICMGIPYARMFVYNIIFSLLFLGGWSPFHPSTRQLSFLGTIILPATAVIGKAIILSLIMVFTRSVYPRYRVDQALSGAWGFWVIVSLLGLIVSIGVYPIIH
jgi:NADH:ubiquinone oxidoreductase subunit H